LKLDDETDLDNATTTPRPMRSSDVVDLPRSSRPAITRPETTRRTRATVAPVRREATPAQVEPKVPEAPVTRPDISEETRKPVPVPAIADEPARTEPKKLQWGQQDTKPTSDSQAKFKWGEKPK